MKFVVVAAIAVVLSIPAMAEDAATYATPMTDKYSQKELMKNWALSSCFYAIAKDLKTKEDASDTASAYAEFGHSQLQAYQELEKLVNKFVAKKYGGSIPSEFNTMKCIDLYHSKELDQLVTKLLKTKFTPQ